MAYPSEVNPGLFVPTTNVWDVAQLQSVDVTSPEFKELLVRLYQNINTISLALNAKSSGYYVPEEFVTGEVYYPAAPSAVNTPGTEGIPIFRKVIDIGALPNTATKTVAHGITMVAPYTFNFVQIYGWASDYTAPAWIPLPYSSPTLANNIEVSVDNTNVTIITGSNRTNFTAARIILAYTKY